MAALQVVHRSVKKDGEREESAQGTAGTKGGNDQEFRKLIVMEHNFEKAFEEIILIEKGYVNDPLDSGGKTKYGISQKSYPNLDIRNLDLQTAKKIYHKDYWLVNGLQNILKYEIALELFDTGVNMGVGIAARFFQEALNLMNRNQLNFPDLIIDGAIGAKTIAAYKTVDDRILLKVLNGLQFERYKKICLADPSQERFFNGWMKRV